MLNPNPPPNDFFSVALRRIDAKPTTRADLFVGIPLCLALALGFCWLLRSGIEAGELSLGRNMIVLANENPYWFAFAVVIHLLLIALFLAAPAGFVIRYRRQRRKG